MTFMPLNPVRETLTLRGYSVFVSFIAAVSLYDAALVLYYSDCIIYLEENPVGLFLIKYNDGNPLLFVLLKLVGTGLVVTALLRLFSCFRNLAVPVVTGVASVQMALLLYLSFA